MKNNKVMIELCAIKNFDNSVPSNILAELQVFSCFKVENEAKESQVLQKYYVPIDEFNFYQEWKEKIINELLRNKQNAVLIQNIARRHGFKLQR